MCGVAGRIGSSVRLFVYHDAGRASTWQSLTRQGQLGFELELGEVID